MDSEIPKSVRAMVVSVQLSEGEKPGRVVIEMGDDGLRLMARLFGQEIMFPVGVESDDASESA